ncbi:MAG TPA: GerMN domain-containing protein [Acidimicrobiia bacterium]|nr:GerMN domain-containing protein [Acidimicrobiia bacterium]
MTRLHRVAAVVALLSVAGCGVRGESTETRIDRDDVPFELLEATPAGGQPPESGAPLVQATIFLESAGTLVAVARELPDPVRARDLLQALASGPTPAEEVFGVQTAITSGQATPSVRTERRLAVVELDDSFFNEGANQVTSLAQIVFTLTELEPIARVRFLVGGEPAEVPRADGVLTSDPVDRDDYASLAPAGTGT